MSGVWVFNKGVVRLVENPNSERKVLVHSASNEIITSYAVLEHKLSLLGWERYYDDPDLLQFHKRSTVDLISLPRDFNKFRSMHMYDIVVKNKNYFEVRDMWTWHAILLRMSHSLCTLQICILDFLIYIYIYCWFGFGFVTCV